MKNLNYFALFLDSVFLFLALFVGLLCIFYFLIPYPYSVILAFCIGGVLAIFGAKFLGDKQNKKHIKSKEKKLYFDTIIRLNLMKPDKLKNLFIKLYSTKNEQVIRKKHGFYLPQSKKLYVTKFAFEKVTKADVVRAFNYLQKEEVAVFLAESFEPDIVAFGNRFNKRIIFLDAPDIFNDLKDKGLLPTQDFTTYYTEKKKITFGAEIFKKKNAKKFLLFGVTFCLMSFIAPYKTYYIVSGCVMIFFAVILKLFGKQENTTTTQVA